MGTACATSSRTVLQMPNASKRRPALAAKIAMYAAMLNWPASVPIPVSAIEPRNVPAAAAKLLKSMKSPIMLVRSSSRMASSARKKKPSS